MGRIGRFAAALTLITSVILTGTVPVRADDTITLSISSSAEEVHSGDIITVIVTADRMPHITSFGPVELMFDPECVEYITVNNSSQLTDFNTTAEYTFGEGIVSVSAVDETSVGAIEELGIETEDPSFFSDEPVILFSVAFRINATTAESIPFRIGGAFNFYKSNGDLAGINVGEGIDIPLAATLSNDASLEALAIEGVTISPPFSPNIYDYTATVNRSVNNVDISAVPGNLWAAVAINGGKSLEYGENIITIDVVAQDTVTSAQYVIHINRQESYTSEGAGLVDSAGVSYAFLNLPAVCVVPEGFTQTTRIINGYSVPVYSRDGVGSVLIYLYDGFSEPQFYFYNPTSRRVIPYSPGSLFVEQSSILSVEQVPEDVDIPSDFNPGMRNIGGNIVEGYEGPDGIFVIYMKDEFGNSSFYRYDDQTGNFFEYHYNEDNSEVFYKILFVTFLAVAVVEAGLLAVTIYIVMKIIKERTNPRPKRV